MRSLLVWLLAKHRRYHLVSCAFDAARAAFWTLTVPETPMKKKSFLQFNPRLEVRVRGRMKRPRGYDYPELEEKDATTRLVLARKVLEKQLQLQ